MIGQFCLDLHIVTGVYGGGVDPGKSDQNDPFRVPSIRGHLRFWWRALYGDHDTHEKLKKAEDLRWGSTDKHSAITIEVLASNPGQGFDIGRTETYTGDDGKQHTKFTSILQPAYVLFPGMPKTGKPESFQLYKNGSFRLRLTVPIPYASELENVLKAWIYFGGIGARTRRGCGALFCSNLPKMQPPRDGAFQDVGSATMERDWTVYRNSRLIIGPKQPTQQAWERAIEDYRKYRQDRFPPTRGKYGRSRWPEPDAIRKIRQIPGIPWAHNRPVTIEDEFPRSQFGLPIVFHFKSDPKGRPDPQDNTLRINSELDRFASPLILKPLACSVTEAYPIALALNTPEPPMELTLRQKDDKSTDRIVYAGPENSISDFLKKFEENLKPHARRVTL